ncbi:MAG: DUF3883 domain-containing protein [Bryobacteraceae bacterium]
MQLLFMNVGSMRAYKGLVKGDTISGGGEYPKTHGFGHEIFNFKPFKGRYYGYGRPANDAIALERLGAPEGSSYIDAVLVVWVAKSHVVGWYKNARVYREWQPPPPGSKRLFRGHECGYYATALDGKLLEREARWLSVPRAKDVPGGMGRYVWYAEGTQHEPFLKKLFDLIGSNGKTVQKTPGSKPGAGAGWQIDPRRRKRIEETAVREVMRYYRAGLGYEIKDRQNEHCGWDFQAIKDGTELYLEVKGIAGHEISVELSANEYKHMKKHRSKYRVCIVTGALSKSPTLSIYGYVTGSKRWEHHEDGTPIRVKSVSVETARLHL